MLNLIFLQSKFFLIIMQALFLKLIFFIPRKGMHTYTFLKWENVVWPAVFLMLCSRFIVKKKKPLLKRILDGSRKFLTPLRLIKKWQHKNKKQGRPFRSAKQTLVFYFLVLLNSFWRREVWTPQSLLFFPVGHTSFARRETGKCAFLFLASQSKFHFSKWYNLLHHLKFRWNIQENHWQAKGV